MMECELFRWSAPRLEIGNPGRGSPGYIRIATFLHIFLSPWLIRSLSEARILRLQSLEILQWQRINARVEVQV